MTERRGSENNEGPDISLRGIGEISTHYRSGKASPIEETRGTLRRIDRHEMKLNAWITVQHEEAIREAQRAGRDFQDGSEAGLDDIPISIKDNIDTAGIRTTCAGKILKDNVPQCDAPVVTKLRKNGAILLGKIIFLNSTIASSTLISDNATTLGIRLALLQNDPIRSILFRIPREISSVADFLNNG